MSSSEYCYSGRCYCVHVRSADSQSVAQQPHSCKVQCNYVILVSFNQLPSKCDNVIAK